MDLNMVEIQPASLEIYAKKFQLKNEDDVPIDKDISDTRMRIATALSALESTDIEKHFVDFLWALDNGAIPGGRIVANVGAGTHKPGASTINCVVSETIADSIDGIMDTHGDAGRSLSSGCGIGYEFSTIRPRGAWVSGVGATTSGVLPFMDIYDKMCFTISSAGGRRGAQMATFDIRHPEVVNFIKAKREEGRFKQFNLSVLITKEFVQAVRSDSDWVFSFPVTQGRYDPELEYIWRDFPVTDNYVTNDQGLIACERYGNMPAKELWDIIMRSNFDYAEPGFLLIDRINELNPLNPIENIRATNPCGEQPLPPGGSCLLGSINLTQFILEPFTDNARFDWQRYHKVIQIFSRMLDNVVEVNGLPLEVQRKEIAAKRRHGMGFLGLGSAMTMLNMVYGSNESIEFTTRVTRDITVIGYTTGVALAREKGMAPVLEDPAVLKSFMDSEYMQRVLYDELTDSSLHEDMAKYGCRYTHCASIAPTGSISFGLANNVSNGIEPSYAHEYKRNVIVEGKATKEQMQVYSYELLAYRQHLGEGISVDKLPDTFVAAAKLSPRAHVDVQAAAQYWLDSASSKTINVATDISFDDFKDVYMYAIDKGCKGVSTYRPSGAYTGVLITDDDLSNTVYEFTLEDGTVLELRGDESIVYDGDTHNVANLYHAISTNVYGKI